MTHFYYQIKAKKCDHAPENCFNSPWSFPPIFSGMVEATDRAEAKKVIEQDYGRKFPTRVLKADLASHDFLLTVREVVGEDGRTHALIEVRECQECKRGFRVIDKYNDDEEFDKGWDFCTRGCREKYYAQKKENYQAAYDFNGIHPPVIYKITHVPSGKCYVGKTTQAFTLRWYQHFFQSSDTKFHQAIKDSNLSDWTFSVLETVIIEEKDKAAKNQKIVDREAYWIQRFNSIDEGFNSVIPVAQEEDNGMEDMFND